MEPEFTELQEALGLLFDQYDLDKNGSIDEDEFAGLVEEITSIHGTAPELACGEEDIQNVVDALDDDGNGTIEKEEWVDWIAAGASRSAELRAEFAATSPFAAKLDAFLTAVCAVAQRVKGHYDKRLEQAKPTPAASSSTVKNSPEKPEISDPPASDSTSAPLETKQPELQTAAAAPTQASTPKKSSTKLDIMVRASASPEGAAEILHVQQGLRLMFRKIDIANTGHITVELINKTLIELPKMYTKLTHNNDSGALAHMCTPEDAPLILQALDADNSGTVEMTEWIQWFVLGSLRSVEQQQSFAEKSPFHLRLVTLLHVVITVSQSLITRQTVDAFRNDLGSLFLRMAKKKDKEIGVKTLKKLLAAVKKESGADATFGAEDADFILSALDADDNGSLSLEEWVSWLLRGTALSKQERTSFSERSSVHANLINFLECCVNFCGGHILMDQAPVPTNVVIEHEMSDDTMKAGLVHLFNKASSGSPKMTEPLLTTFVSKLPEMTNVGGVELCTAEDIGALIDSLDEDGDKEISHEEWENWLMHMDEMDEEEVEQFSAQSQTHARIARTASIICKISFEMMSPLAPPDSLRPGLDNIFADYDSDRDGSITAQDFTRMIFGLHMLHPQVEWFDPTIVNVDLIITSLDEDGNGTIDFNEWVEWVTAGASRAAHERLQFAAHNPTFKTLTLFLEFIVKVAQKITILSRHTDYCMQRKKRPK